MLPEMRAPTTTTTTSAARTQPPFQHLNYYSAPTSPNPSAYKPMFDQDQTQPPSPTRFTCDYYDHDHYEDANNNFIDFEFETAQSFESLHQQKTNQEHHQHKDSLPAMAFADELFCNGKVVPLKPPPPLRNVECNFSSPRNPAAALKFPFPRRSLWNDDFDPFMVALENVKDDKTENRNKAKDHRRTRSMSPLRAIYPMSPNKSMSFHHPEINPSGPDLPEKDSQKTPVRLGESKGALFARHTRLVKMGREKDSKHTERGGESGETCTRESKKQRIKKFLFRSASSIVTGMGRASSNEEKRKDESEAALPPKKGFARKFSLIMSTAGNGVAE